MGQGYRHPPRRWGISRQGLRAASVIIGYVCLLFALGIAFASPWQDISAGTALTVALVLFVAGAVGSLLANLMTRSKDWNPPLAAALTLIPLPSALLSLLLWTANR
jgi:hypothetical protein